MAKIIRRIEPHNCQEELQSTDETRQARRDCAPGTTAECSCGKQFILAARPHDIRSEKHWKEMTKA